MGHIGDKVCAEGFCSLKLRGHFIDGGDDLVKAGFSGEFSDRRNPDGKIPLHHLIQGRHNLLHRLIHHPSAAHIVDGCRADADQQHIAEGQLGRGGNVLLCEHQPHGIRQNGHKQCGRTGHNKGHQQKKGHIVLQCPEEGVFSVFLHLTTAL